MILLLTATNMRGLVWGKLIQNTFTVAKTAALAGLIILAIRALTEYDWPENVRALGDRPLDQFMADGQIGEGTLQGGEVLGELRVRSVRRDSVVVQGSDTTWRLGGEASMVTVNMTILSGPA